MRQVKRCEIIKALEEFDRQEHDWITVPCTTKTTTNDQRRMTVFNFLEDKEFVTKINERSFLGEKGKPTDDQGRIITSEKVYRVTAAGREATLPLWRRASKNVMSNTPTIIVSVLSAVLVSWAIYYFGAPTETETITVESHP